MSTTLIAPWRGNLLAPMWAGVTPQLPGYCDVEFDFVPVQVTIPPGGLSLKNQLPVDMDADYLGREFFVSPIAGTTSGANPQDLKIRITDGDSNAITSDWITANDINGVFGPSVLPFRKGSVILVDFWNQGTATLVVMMGIKGFKRFPCNDKQGPLPPFYPESARFCKEWEGVRFEEYEYFYEFSNYVTPFSPPWAQSLNAYGASVFRQVPLPTDNDADFLWRGTTGQIMRSGAAGLSSAGRVSLRFYDHNIVPLANVIPTTGLGPGAELVLSDGGGRMSPAFPEILIPRGSSAAVDIGVNLNLSATQPVLIDPTAFSTASRISYPTSSPNGGYGGPGMRPWVFFYNGAFYMALQSRTDPTGLTGAGGMFVSTNNGATWTRLDTADQPAFGGALTCFYEGGSTVYLAYTDAARKIYVTTFDLATQTWGTPSAAAAGVALYNVAEGGFHVTRLSNGDIYVVYNIFNAATDGTLSTGVYSRYSGGVWGNPVQVTSKNAATFFDSVMTVVTDVNDVTHVLFEEFAEAVLSSNVYHIPINAAGVVGAATVAYANPTSPVAGSPVILGNTLYVPFGLNSGGQQMYVLVGSNITGMPSWNLSTGPDVDEISVPSGAAIGQSCSCVDAAGTLWLFWIVTNNFEDAAPQQIWGNSYTKAGGWGTPFVAYDYSVDPANPAVPIGSGADPYIYGLSVAPGAAPGQFMFQMTAPDSPGAANPSAQPAGFSFTLPAQVTVKFSLRGFKVYNEADCKV